ncbi:tyrosine-protein kinase ABL1-like [Glandiceps talaboti]
MKNGEFNTTQLRDGINKKYLCNLHRNFGLNLNDVLHQGDTSLVYKGTIIGAKQSVIVKICVVHTVEELHLIDTQAAKKLNNEITILRELDHPNIVPVLAYWNSAPPLHYISTFASHGSLLRYLRINRNRNIVIPQQLLYRIALDVVMALRYLGDKHIVHRNIMARKVFLCNDNGEIRVLLGGFEHAVKMSEGTSQHQGTIDESMAVYWSAAESLLYQRYSIKSDVWMFAVLCYELFTLGCEPYQDYHELTIEDVMFKIVHHRLRFKKPDCIPDVMFQLMMECMDINPSKRPSYDVITSTINDVISRIKNAADLPGRSMTSRPPILQVRRGSFGNVAIGNELDDEYVYCTTGKDKRPGGIEARFQNDDISTKVVNELQGNLLNPPPDLLIRAGHSGQLDQCITENIDHIVRKDEPVVCSTQSITADDQPNIQTQLIENPINPSVSTDTTTLDW